MVRGLFYQALLCEQQFVIAVMVAIDIASAFAESHGICSRC